MDALIGATTKAWMHESLGLGIIKTNATTRGRGGGGAEGGKSSVGRVGGEWGWEVGVGRGLT